MPTSVFISRIIVSYYRPISNRYLSPLTFPSYLSVEHTIHASLSVSRSILFPCERIQITFIRRQHYCNYTHGLIDEITISVYRHRQMTSFTRRGVALRGSSTASVRFFESLLVSLTTLTSHSVELRSKVRARTNYRRAIRRNVTRLTTTKCPFHHVLAER